MLHSSKNTVFIRALKNKTDNTYLNFQLRQSDIDGLSIYNKSAIEKDGNQVCQIIASNLKLPKRYFEFLKNFICSKHTDVTIAHKGRGKYHYVICFKDKKLPDDIEYCNERLHDIYQDVFDTSKIYTCNKQKTVENPDTIKKIKDSTYLKHLDNKIKRSI